MGMKQKQTKFLYYSKVGIAELLAVRRLCVYGKDCRSYIYSGHLLRSKLQHLLQIDTYMLKKKNKQTM